MKETTWLLIEVEDIPDVGKSEKQRHLLKHVTFKPTDLLFGITALTAYCLSVDPATEATKE